MWKSLIMIKKNNEVKAFIFIFEGSGWLKYIDIGWFNFLYNFYYRGENHAN
jgi:hypothetical protein